MIPQLSDADYQTSRIVNLQWVRYSIRSRHIPHVVSLCRFLRTDKPIRLKTPSRSTTKKKSKNEDKVPDSAQLKGALWPGMDLFDSATPEMKRMRNQRKDSNVMRQMKAKSAEIEPAEISYFADGEFRASRDIFGPLSDVESPVCVPVFPPSI